MALLNFPNTRLNGSPLQNGDEYTGDNGVTYIYNNGKWVGHSPVLADGTNSLVNNGYVVQVDVNGNLILEPGKDIRDSEGNILAATTSTINTGNWIFDSDTATTNGNIIVKAGPTTSSWASLLSNDGDNSFWVDNAGAHVTTDFSGSENYWTFGTNGNLTLPDFGAITSPNYGFSFNKNSGKTGAPEIGTDITFATENLSSDIVDGEVYMGSGYGEFRSIYNKVDSTESGLVYAGVEGFNYANYGNVNFAGMISQTPNIDSMYTVGVNTLSQITIGFTQNGQTQESMDWSVVVGSLTTDYTVNGLFADTFKTVISGSQEIKLTTDRGTVLFGNQPECVPTLLTHFHIMKEDASAVDLFLGDDYNYVKLPGSGETAYGVEIGTNVGSAYTWRFGTDGKLTVPGRIATSSLSGVAISPTNSSNSNLDWNFNAIGKVSVLTAPYSVSPVQSSIQFNGGTGYGQLGWDGGTGQTGLPYAESLFVASTGDLNVVGTNVHIRGGRTGVFDLGNQYQLLSGGFVLGELSGFTFIGAQFTSCYFVQSTATDYFTTLLTDNLVIDAGSYQGSMAITPVTRTSFGMNTNNKYVFQIKMGRLSAIGNNIGVITESGDFTQGLGAANFDYSVGFESYGVYNGPPDYPGAPNFGVDDYVIVAVDRVNHKIWIKVLYNEGNDGESAWNSDPTADPTTNTGGFDLPTFGGAVIYPAVTSVNGNNYTDLGWTFGSDGVITLPSGNTRIGDVNGLDSIVSNTGTAFGVVTQGTGGFVVLEWIGNNENIGTTASTQVAAVVVNSPFASSTGTVQIATGVSTGTNSSNTWEFSANGNLLFPSGAYLIADSQDGTYLQANPGVDGYAGISNLTGSSWMWTANDGGAYISSGGTWSFNTNSNLNIPGDIQDANGSVIRVATTSTAPTRHNGQLWFDNQEGRLYIKNDGVWLDASPTQIPSPETYLDGLAIDGTVIGTANVNGDAIVIDGGDNTKLTVSNNSVTIQVPGTLTRPYWAAEFGGITTAVTTSSMTVGTGAFYDSQGNVYVLGGVQFDTNEFFGLDSLLLKYDTNGNLLWSRTWHDDSGANCGAINQAFAIDSNDRIYWLAAAAVPGFGCWTGYMDTEGNLGLGGVAQGSLGFLDGNFAGADIACDNSGNYYLAGVFFDGSGAETPVVIKVDGDTGIPIWTSSIIPEDFESLPSNGTYRAVTVNPATGDVWAIGDYNDGGLRAMLSKWDINGTHQWTKKLVTQTGDLASAVIYNGGYVYTIVNDDGEQEAVVSKFDTDGVLIWASFLAVGALDPIPSGAPGSYSTGAYDLSFDTAGNVYVTGTIPSPPAGQPQLWITKLDPANGEMLYSRILATAQGSLIIDQGVLGSSLVGHRVGDIYQDTIVVTAITPSDIDDSTGTNALRVMVAQLPIDGSVTGTFDNIDIIDITSGIDSISSTGTYTVTTLVWSTGTSTAITSTSSISVSYVTDVIGLTGETIALGSGTASGTTTTNTWTFVNNNIILPPGGDILDSNGVSVLGATTSTSANGWQLTSSTAVVSLTSDGTLTLPNGSSISDKSVAIRLEPSGASSSTQALLIYPTVQDGNHIHLTADGGSTDLYLGDDDQYVKVDHSGTVVIGTLGANTSTWVFGTDGSLTLPIGSYGTSGFEPMKLTSGDQMITLGGTGTNILIADLGAGPGIYFRTQNNDHTGTQYSMYFEGDTGSFGVPRTIVGNSGKLDLNYDGSVILSGIPSVNAVIQTTNSDSSNTSTWTFGADGALTFPDNTRQTTAWTGTVITSVGTLTSLSVSGNVTATKFIGDGSSLTNVTVNVAGSILGTGTNVTLVAGSYSYLFDNTGTLTMPANGDIVMTGINSILSNSGTTLLGGYSQVGGYYSTLGVKYPGGNTQYAMTLQPTADNTNAITFLNAAGTNIGSITQTTSTVKFVGDGSQLTGVATRTTGTWTVPTGVGTYSITVPINGAYQMWVRANIPNGIITYQATVHVSNTNVPVLGSQRAWNYTGGGSPILLTSMPNQIVGAEGTISTSVVSTTTANRFDFGINNSSTSSQIVSWGYVTL